MFRILDQWFSKEKVIFFVAFFFLLVNLIFFRGFGNIFFLQDEWLLFGRVVHNMQNGVLGLFAAIGIHVAPLAHGFWYIQYRLFGLDASYYACMAVFLHSLAAVIFFIFLKKFLKHSFIAFFLSLLFLVNVNTAQAFFWLAVYYTYIPSLIFTFLFFICLFHCQTNQRISSSDVLLLFLLFLFGFSFLETAAIIVPLLPIYWYLFWPKGKKKEVLPPLSVLFFLLVGTMAIRLLAQFFFGEKTILEKGDQLLMSLYNILTMPPKVIVQNLFSIDLLLQLAKVYTRFAFPWLMSDSLIGSIQEKVIFEHIVLIFFIFLSMLIIFIWARLARGAGEKKIIIFALAWILFSSLVIAPQGRRVYYLESRYLYFGSIGVLLLVFATFTSLARIHKKFKLIIASSAFILALLFIFFSYIKLRSRLPYYLEISDTRKSIISQILTLYPKIPPNAIFYVTCREDCRPDGFILPFQSGVGQMLLVLYSRQNEKAYAPFLGEYFLWGLEAEDYRRIGDYSFGYFCDLGKVKKLVDEGRVKPGDVIALEYQRGSNNLIDISPEIQATLKSDSSTD